MTAHPIHFVGSIPLADADSVFRALAASVGDRAKRWPDGEIGERGYWIRWQKQTFDNHPDFVLKALQEGGPFYKDKLERPFYVIRDGVDAADVRVRLAERAPFVVVEGGAEVVVGVEVHAAV